MPSSLTPDAPQGRAGVFSRARRGFALGLSAKLLLLTVAFVMVVEVLIFMPSVANFRKNWLTQRLVAAKIASLALEASEGAELPARLRQELLMTAGVHAVSLRRPDFRRLVLGMTGDQAIAQVYDLRSAGFAELIRDGLESFVAPPGRLIRVIGASDMTGGDEIDVVIDETPLRAAVWHFARNIFWLSLLISVTTAALVYVALNALLVRPMMRLTRNMVLYRADPEDASRVIVPSGRRDEIGVAEKELAGLQTQLSGFLREKARLANLGLAVSKINHDLRNMLASAQLVSDRLAAIADPTVQLFAPRLIRALDRAIALCVDTLKYGRSVETPVKTTRFGLRPLLVEVKESLGMDDHDGIKVTLSVAPGLELSADRDQIFRVFANLMRNALEALKGQDPPQGDPAIEISAARQEGALVIRVSDNGPGVPEQARAHLFQAFQSSSRGNGTGLGLAICAELLRAHGGNIALEAGSKGAAFLVTLPESAAAEPARSRNASGRADRTLAH